LYQRKSACSRSEQIEQAGSVRAFLATTELGTSMSAHHILGVEKLPRVRRFSY